MTDLFVPATPAPNIRPDVPDDLPYSSAVPEGDGYRLTFRSESLRDQSVLLMAAHNPSWPVPPCGIPERELVAAIPTYVPERVDPGHLLVALLNFDEAAFDAVESAIETDKQVRAAMRGSFVSRHSLMLQGFCQQLGITEEQKNALFRAAATLHL